MDLRFLISVTSAAKPPSGGRIGPQIATQLSAFPRPKVCGIIFASMQVLPLLCPLTAAFGAPVATDSVTLERRATPLPLTDTTFINTILTRVNSHGAQHAAKPPVWDTCLLPTARAGAAHFNSACAMTSKSVSRVKITCRSQVNDPYDENILLTLASYTPDFIAQANAGIDYWYSEVSKYGVSDPAPAYHCTQLVWTSWTKIGCLWSPSQCPDTRC